MILKKLIFILPIVCILVFVNCGNGDDIVYKQGKILYTNMCANCHQDNGEGVRGLIPPLAKSDYLPKHRSELACLIRQGQKGNIVVNGVTYGAQEMLGIASLSEFEIVNVLNYVTTSWGNQGELWKVEEVREALKKCE